MAFTAMVFATLTTSQPHCVESFCSVFHLYHQGTSEAGLSIRTHP